MGYYVYIHTCKDNGKKYVGVTGRNPESRWKEGRGYKTNKHFYSAILKYGWTNFEHEVFEVDSKEEMYRKEVELISFYHSNDPEFGYNNSSGGEKSALGCKYSEEYRKRLSELRKGKKRGPFPEEWRKHIAEAKKGKPAWNKGKKMSEEYCRIMSERRKGKSLSLETRKKISETLKGRPGKPHSEEQRKKISETLKNRPRIKIKLQDGTIIEVTKQNLARNYVNKGKKFEYVD